MDVFSSNNKSTSLYIYNCAMNCSLDDIFTTHNGYIAKLNEVCPLEQQTKDYPLNKDYSKLIYINNEIPVGYINCDLVTTRKTDNGVFIYSITLLPSYSSIEKIFKTLLDYTVNLAQTNHQKYITFYLPWDYDTLKTSPYNTIVHWFINNGQFQPVFPDLLELDVDKGGVGIKKVPLKRQL